MQQNLARALDLILTSEGGYVDHPDDAGGPTMMGVTQATLAAWRKAPVTIAEVMALGRAEAEAIYQAQYAAKVAFDALPAGIDYAVLDAAVNSGPARAAIILQKLVGVKPDGIIGAMTLAAIEAVPINTLIADYSVARLAFMQSLRNWGTFARGWQSRVAWVRQQALVMQAGIAPAGPPITLELAAAAKASGPVKLTQTVRGNFSLATFLTVLATAGTMAAQASGFLQPYGDVAAVRYLLIALSVVSAAGSLALTIQRNQAGLLH